MVAIVREYSTGKLKVKSQPLTLNRGHSSIERIPEGTALKFPLISALVLFPLLAGRGSDPGPAGAGRQPAFRVRSDFTAALNADQGWAGALNESVVIPADRPFRVRWKAGERPFPASSPEASLAAQSVSQPTLQSPMIAESNDLERSNARR